MRCVLLHPQPDFGGNQYNNVIAALFAALDDAARFDFISSDPAVAAGQVLAQLNLGPAWLVGYSFGGAVASLVDDPRVLGWCLIAPALAIVEPVIGPDDRPKHILAAEQDTFFSPASLQDATAAWTATTHDVVAGAQCRPDWRALWASALSRVTSTLAGVTSRTAPQLRTLLLSRTAISWLTLCRNPEEAEHERHPLPGRLHEDDKELGAYRSAVLVVTGRHRGPDESADRTRVAPARVTGSPDYVLGGVEIGAIMKAIQYNRFGGPEVLELVELPDPHPGSGEIRVAVRAVGVNPIDWKPRSGMMGGESPQATGREAAGVVDELGEDVEDVAPGDRVFGFVAGGGARPSWPSWPIMPLSRLRLTSQAPPPCRWRSRPPRGRSTCSGWARTPSCS